MIFNIPINRDGPIPLKISKLTKITGAQNQTYPELSVARATLVLLGWLKIYQVQGIQIFPME